MIIFFPATALTGTVEKFGVFTHQEIQHLQGRQEDHLHQEVQSHPLVLKRQNMTCFSNGIKIHIIVILSLNATNQGIQGHQEDQYHPSDQTRQADLENPERRRRCGSLLNAGVIAS